ncbi:MAG: hypothetical protein HY956_01270 [Deltaproteobacteria bacterium]|nr:hypothetical protein [Deltaproteobacteria bacterium]
MAKLAYLVLLILVPVFFPAVSYGSEESLRGRLLGSRSVEALYSIDDYLTVVSGKEAGPIEAELKSICPEGLKIDGDGAVCGELFETRRLEGPKGSGKTFYIVLNAAPQPFVYRNSLPSLNELPAPANGMRLREGYKSVDLLQYMSALCKIENGTPEIVVSKRYGRTVRLTKVGGIEAFNYFLYSGEGKDPWYFACHGDQKFVIEKDYTYSPKDEMKLFYYQNRGLEGIDFVKEEGMSLERNTEDFARMMSSVF